MGSMWTTHVERGLEGTMDISKVIKVRLTSEGVSDINDHPSGESHNESFILRVRRQFRQRIYDDDIPCNKVGYALLNIVYTRYTS